MLQHTIRTGLTDVQTSAKRRSHVGFLSSSHKNGKINYNRTERVTFSVSISISINVNVINMRSTKRITFSMSYRYFICVS